MKPQRRKKRRDLGRFEQHRDRVFYRAHTYADADELSSDAAIAEGLAEYLEYRASRGELDD